MTTNSLDQFLSVPGARTTLPVSAAKQGFSATFADEARQHFDNFHYQMGGDQPRFGHVDRSSAPRNHPARLLVDGQRIRSTPCRLPNTP